MQYYAGIDLHARNCVVCKIDEQENEPITATAPNDLPSILTLLEKIPQKNIFAQITQEFNWLFDFPSTIRIHQ